MSEEKNLNTIIEKYEKTIEERGQSVRVLALGKPTITEISLSVRNPMIFLPKGVYFDRIVDGYYSPMYFLICFSLLKNDGVYLLISPPTQYFADFNSFVLGLIDEQEKLRLYRKKSTEKTSKDQWKCISALLGLNIEENGQNIILKKVADKRLMTIMLEKIGKFLESVSKVRESVRKKIREIIDNEDLAEDIETELYLVCDMSDEIPYREQARSLFYNLRENTQLLSDVKGNEITPKQLVRMTNEEMATKNIKALRQLLVKQAELDRVVGENETTMTKEFKCPRCGERNASFYQRQVRAADEPMTIFLHCLKCGHRWKR